MLQQYRRHAKKCAKGYNQHGRKHTNCKCVVYVEGKLNRTSEYIKESTGTRSWEEARRMIVAAEQHGSWRNSAAEANYGAGTPDPSEHASISVCEAVDAFLAEAGSEKGRNLAAATLGKYKTLLGRLKIFCTDRGFVRLDELQLSHLLTFKHTWPTGPRATRNNIQRLRSFFRHCVNLKWVPENPAQHLKMPQGIKNTQKLPFSANEMSRILEVAQTIQLHEKQAINNIDLYAFILTMRYTGLRISDTGLLTADRLQGNSLFLYARKNGALVYCPLLPWVGSVLRSLPLKHGQYLFCSGSTRLETVVELWGKRLKQVFDRAGIHSATSHRFRHTFAVDLLENGVDIKNVSMLLGHESVLTTEEHYSAWIQSRQDALNADVLRAYERGQQDIRLMKG